MSKEHFWKIDWKPIDSSSNVIWPIQKDHFRNFDIKEDDLWLDANPDQEKTKEYETQQAEIEAYKAPFLKTINKSYTWMKEILASVNWGMITNPDKRYNQSIKFENDKIIVVSGENTHTYTMKDGHIVMTRLAYWDKEKEMTVLSEITYTIETAYVTLKKWIS